MRSQWRIFACHSVHCPTITTTIVPSHQLDREHYRQVELFPPWTTGATQHLCRPFSNVFCPNKMAKDILSRVETRTRASPLLEMKQSSEILKTQPNGPLGVLQVSAVPSPIFKAAAAQKPRISTVSAVTTWQVL